MALPPGDAAPRPRDVPSVRPLFFWLCALLSAPLLAHPEWKEAICIGVIDDEQVLDFKIRFDVPSFYVGKPSKEATVKELDELMFTPASLESAAKRAPEVFQKGIRVLADGVEVPIEGLAFPTAAEVRELSLKQGEADRYPVLLSARFRAKLPARTSQVTVRFPPELGSVMTNLRKGMESQVLMSVAAGTSGSFVIGETDFSLRGFWLDGFGHVIPAGWDHALFMLAMVLASASLAEALKRSLVFTLGHAITLTLVVTGTLPPIGGWIEPVIAATIAYGGYLAFRRTPAKTAWLLLPLAFGLIHGLGFAAAAAAKLQGIGGGDLGKLLLGFNLGVETAQAGIIVATTGLLLALTKLGADASKVRRWTGLAIALAGTAIALFRLWAWTKGA